MTRARDSNFFDFLSLYEKPGSVTTSSVPLHWWCDLELSSKDATTNNYGYVERGVEYLLGSTLEYVVAQGAQLPSSKKRPVSVSAVLVPSLGIFEGQIHPTHDDLVFRYWDDGSSTQPLLGWEGHVEGDTHPNSDTSALSGSGTIAKITLEAAAELLSMDVADMTPATYSIEYEEAWNTTYVPDPIDASVKKLEDSVAQLQADNKELMSRIATIEESLTANGSGSSGDGDGGDATSTLASSFMAWYEHDTMVSVAKSIMSIAVIIGLVAVDFIG